jgi:beta-lactamase regulating signal transducer with metallopeptidase domain
MILGWMTYSILMGTLGILAAHALENAARVLGKPSRWIWFASLVATLAVSLTALYESVGMAIRFIPRRHGSTWLDGPASSYIKLYNSVEHWDIYLSPLLWISSALTAGMFAVAIWRLVQRRRAWQRTSLDGHSVLVSEAEGPAIVGFIRSAIVVPKWALAESERIRSLIMAHELEHQRAGDHLLSALALLATIAQPWNPAVWWIARRLRVAAGCRMPVPALSRPLSSLEERLQIITAERRSGRLRAARLALVAVMVLATAAFVPEPGALHCMLEWLGFKVNISASY